MAASEFIADTLLIAAAKEAGMLLRSGEDSITSRLRGIINREQRLYLAALLRKAREGYLEDYASISVVAGTTRYRLPTRAVASAVTLVQEVVSDGFATLQPLGKKSATGDGLAFAAGEYYFEDNYLVLVTTPSVSTTLRVTYQRRLNKVVAGTAACVVTAINRNLVTIHVALASDGTTTTPPSTWTQAQLYDFVRGTPHFDVFAKDQVCSNVGTGPSIGILTLAEIPTELVVGDFIALAGETPIANVPLELQDVLVLRTVYMALAGSGNPNAERFKGILEEAESYALTLMQPRAKDSPPIIQNFNGPGWNRFRAFRRYGG